VEQQPMNPAPLTPPESATPATAVVSPGATMLPVVPGPAVRRSRGTRILNAVLAVAVALAIAGVAFAVGRFSAPAAAAAGRFGNGGPGQLFNGNGNANGSGNGGGRGTGGFLAGGGVTIEGTVESITDTTLTLKTASGQTIQIALGGTTTYHAQSDASASKVKSGGTVLVRLNLRGGFGNAGPGSSPGTADGGATNPTASDVTVVP
jgi:hypothetical protein